MLQRENYKERERSTAYVDGDSAARSAAATSCAERTAGSGSRVVKRVNQQQCTQHLVHSHDTCALHTHALALSLYCVLSRPNETERRLARRSLSHWLPAYTKICSEQFSLKSSLAEFTSHQSRPARHAAVAQPNNKRLTTVEVEAAVDAQVEVAEQQQQQQSKANANANYTRRKRKFTASPAHLCVRVSVSTSLCVCF